MEFEISYEFNASAQVIYEAWLNNEAHTAMTGGEANVNSNIGETFTAWDEYISGKNIALNPFSEIVQNWRTVEFKEDQPDSILEINFIEISSSKTKLILKHSGLLPEDIKYKQGWMDSYFKPMSIYFDSFL